MLLLLSKLLVSYYFYSILLIYSASGTSSSSAASAASRPPPRSSSRFHRFPGRFYQNDDDDFGSSGWSGSGREFDLFDTRCDQHSNEGASSAENNSKDGDDLDIVAPWATEAPTASKRQRRTFVNSNYQRSAAARGGAASSTSKTSGGSFNYNYNNNNAYASRPSVFQTVQDWWTSNITPSIKNWPRIQCRVEPTTTLKIRKTFRPLKTIVRFGADFNTQLGVWQFKSSWEDAIIGGKITLAGKELQLSKSWQLSVGT